jgi:5'-3' exonuclease
MGIRGLNTCIQTVCPSSITHVNWTSLNNKRIGVDIQCFLYRAIANQLCPLKILAEQIVNFRKLNLTPIYVFDGKPPTEKSAVVTKRKTERTNATELCAKLRSSLESITDAKQREKILNQIKELESKNPSISYETKNEIKQFLYASGTLFVTAISEADSLLAYLFKRDIVDLIATFDLDLIPRGTHIIVPTNINNPPGSQWLYYDYNTIIKGLGLTETRFVELCVLMGSDYTQELAIVPWVIAHSSIRAGLSLRTIWERHTFCNWRKINPTNSTDIDLLKLTKAMHLLLGTNDTLETLVEHDQRDKLTNISKNNEQQALCKFKKLYDSWPDEWWSYLGITEIHTPV